MRTSLLKFTIFLNLKITGKLVKEKAFIAMVYLSNKIFEHFHLNFSTLNDTYINFSFIKKIIKVFEKYFLKIFAKVFRNKY